MVTKLYFLQSANTVTDVDEKESTFICFLIMRAGNGLGTAWCQVFTWTNANPIDSEIFIKI